MLAVQGVYCERVKVGGITGTTLALRQESAHKATVSDDASGPDHEQREHEVDHYGVRAAFIRAIAWSSEKKPGPRVRTSSSAEAHIK